MSKSLILNSITKEGVDILATQQGEPAWSKELRTRAWETYLKKPFPKESDPGWKKTKLSLLDFSRLSAKSFEAQKDKSADPLLTDNLLDHIAKLGGLVFSYQSQDSSFCQVKLSQEASAKGVKLVTIPQASQETPEILKRFETSEPESENDKFILMSRALFNCGGVLSVPDNVEIEDPFVFVTNLAADCVDGALFPRIIVSVGKNSRIKVVNLFTSAGSKESSQIVFSNALTQIQAEDGAYVSYVEVQNYADNVFSLNRQFNNLKRDARIYSLSVGLGGKQLRSDITTEMAHTGASASIMGVALASSGQSVHYNTIQEHVAPHTTSNIDFRIALKNHAVSCYHGNIKISKDAQQSDAVQSSKNLLLGEDAKAEAVPNLEILANDVKCSHGATVGPVDREQIFYLNSRGLDKTTAEELIITGFFNTVLATNPIAGVDAFIQELVAKKVQDQI
ncbi:MAG: Fe-S cluster assembly protein SufD [Cyanobacteria bacterium TGS_CYA1]|nr:Fe-S cluster assembly protein SufD [Cyanobacteria bacterium TGS_CYA1]